MVYRPIQIKYSIASNNVPTLIPGELAFTQAGNNFFIGAPDGSAGNIRIGHKLNDGTLTANQALVANSTGGINRIYTSEINTTNLTVQVIRTDQIYTRNINVTSLTANGSTGTAGYVLASSSNGTYWTPVTSLIGNLQVSDSGNLTANNIFAIGDAFSNNVVSNNVTASGNIYSNIVISNNVITGNVYSNNVTASNLNSNNVNSNNIFANTLTVKNLIANGSPGLTKYILTSGGPNGNVYWANSIPEAPYYYSNQMYDYTAYGIGWMNVAPNQNAQTLGFRTDITIPFGAIWILAINDGLTDPTPITIYSPSTRTTPMLWMSIDGTGPFNPDTNPHGQAYWFNITPPPSGA
jgi:hypothetical protein